MANLLHRLFRSRTGAERNAPADADEAAPAQSSAEPVLDEPSAEESQVDEPPVDGPAAHDEAAEFEAMPKTTRGRRKTSDEIASIGPGEPQT